MITDFCIESGCSASLALVAEDQFTLVVECSHGTSLVVAKVAVHVCLLVQHAMQSHHFERIRSKCFGKIADHQW